MKKIFLSILLIAVISPVFAQNVKYGISGGLNESILSLQNPAGNSNSRLTGFHAGVFSDIDFGKLSIEPGLFYTTKGEKNTAVLYQYTSPGGSFIAKGKTTYNYLEIPVNVLYNIPIGVGKFFIGGGPYIAYGLSGKTTGTTIIATQNGTTTTSNDYPLTFGSQEGDIKRFDFGLGALGGFALKNGLLVSVGYEHGLTNIDHSSDDHIKNNVITVSLGYSFL
jgi:hypothetical protein